MPECSHLSKLPVSLGSTLFFVKHHIQSGEWVTYIITIKCISINCGSRSECPLKKEKRMSGNVSGIWVGMVNNES